MRLIIKGLRNGLGGIIAVVSWAFAPTIITRTVEKQEAVNELCKTLKLYQLYACPFCIKTRRAMRRLNLPIETRDVQSGVFRDELVANGGKVQVPCLKIENDNKVQWLYESSDINTYLDKKFG